MSVEVFVDYMSSPARAVLALCRIGKINIKINSLRVFKGENAQEKYLKLNPLWTIPFIIDHDNNDFRLTESNAIMKYLLKTRNGSFKESLYPKDPVIVSKIDEYLDWHHSNLRKAAWYIFKNINPDAPAVSGYIKEKLDNDFLDSILTLENYFLKDDKFIGGADEMSIADIGAFFELYELVILDFDFSPYPKISKWMKTILNIPEMKDANKEFIDGLKRFLNVDDIKPRF